MMREYVPRFRNPNPRPQGAFSSVSSACRNNRKPRRYAGNHPTKRRSWDSGRSKPAPPPLAPRNTTSFWMRASKSGGITSPNSPYPETPSVLPTPTFFPEREGLVDLATEKWGVDGYGSMKGSIRLRQREITREAPDVETGDVERRWEHDLSRFEMVGCSGLDNKVDEQEMQIRELEEQNLVMKERVSVMEMQMTELRRRVVVLESVCQAKEEVFDADDLCSETNQ